MLFWRFLFVLIFTAFPGMAHDSCGEGESKCMRMTPDLMNFPDTAEKMKERCSAFKSMVECGISHQETCPNDSAFSIKPIFEPLLERINKFCDETDIWFKEMLRQGEVLERFGRSMKKEYFSDCRAESEKWISESNFDTQGKPDKRRCYFKVGVAKCIFEKLSTDCGTTATELILHFGKGDILWHLLCPGDQYGIKNEMNGMGFSFEPKDTDEEFKAKCEDEA